MIKKIAHIGLATRSIGVSMEFFKNALGLELEATEIVADQKVRVAFLKVGDSNVELLEPTEQDSPVARFIEKRGEGFHHLTLEVDNIEAHLIRLKKLNVRLIDERPRRGAGGRRIAFVHPNSTGGVLIELAEPAGGDTKGNG
ncbi:MAG: methylmalonyl-CoA epimerase [Acidobacteria bacterium]|nr:methylmalonyl-CoA epimerase [Acidobacteriota bacterium]